MIFFTRNISYKLTYIPGLQEQVLGEIKNYPDIAIVEKKTDALYAHIDSNFENMCALRSVLNIFLVERGEKLNPFYLNTHKSILGDLIELVLEKNTAPFKTFKISCAGEDSKEVTKIKEYVGNTYKLTYADLADLEINIGKSRTSALWEVAVRATPRPLSSRVYRETNIPGGLNATIAYVMNTLVNLEDAHTYLNIFSGSGTLLIEAGLQNKKLKLLGFDINGKTVAEAVKNIKKAGLLPRANLTRADIYDDPALGKFDIITSDLPFGMQISKDEDLEKLYEHFVNYCEKNLNQKGKLVTITSEHELLEKKLINSQFKIAQTFDVIIPTSVGAYLRPKIFVSELR